MAAPHIKPEHKGLMHKDLGVAANKPLTVGQIMKERNSKDPKKEKRGTFALMAKRHFKPLPENLKKHKK